MTYFLFVFFFQIKCSDRIRFELPAGDVRAKSFACPQFLESVCYPLGGGLLTSIAACYRLDSSEDAPSLWIRRSSKLLDTTFPRGSPKLILPMNKSCRTQLKDFSPISVSEILVGLHKVAKAIQLQHSAHRSSKLHFDPSDVLRSLHWLFFFFILHSHWIDLGRIFWFWWMMMPFM